MVSKQSHRKDEHVSLAIKFYDEKSHAGFDHLRFIHQGIPEISLNEVSLESYIDKIDLDFPFYIEAMTGGSEYTKKLNQSLAKIAEETGIAMATGSQSVALKDSTLSDSFSIVRETNPNGTIFSNIGASVDVKNAQKAVDMMDSNALEIHINTPQEIIMPEGDREFNWIDNIKEINQNLNVPVIVKEVGFGMSAETIQRLIDNGVKNINISGKGGTNFSKIENYRRKEQELDYLSDWGQTTVESLLETKKAHVSDDITIIASGGIRTPLDAAKAISLGADAVGIAAPILYSLIKNGEDETVRFINDFKDGLINIMTMLGCRSISELKKIKMIADPYLQNYINQRNIPY
ncbi:MAG: type 2 isopentenyl-diphosphate Delta-isomerase [Apilactobacillus sp.]|uniref:type 2 isopentenyl-diphosphate Delta-isomerase n=1 Tax=Apilactobacillus sp. TaxID=2767901 RepID=UPI0025DF99A8|nr:type 2 isopentenyl-diphosphate Delta-isomerase [Apilactobacillus sp.]MCT6822326.1 type 2 isopentenyl-diphosphate Delta-isomerase [Apilactobacillus sp.]MCT6857668.1 type 2 isopentenyl-diphosphate Delta-isomerase [Apilactobacillus sp.]